MTAGQQLSVAWALVPWEDLKEWAAGEARGQFVTLISLVVDEESGYPGYEWAQ